MSTRQPQDRDDDDVEVVIVRDPTPAPRPRQRRPRTPNPVVDEVIHTGEIMEPRSHIVRASDSQPVMPKIEVREDPTEPIRPIAPQAPRRWRVLWLVGAVLAAVGGLGLGFVDTTPPAVADNRAASLTATAEMIGTTFEAEARAALVRATSIATSSMLRAGIETDGPTLADMVRDKDLVVSVDRGEVVEIFQIRDATRSSMLRIPSSAPALQPPTPGTTRFEPRGKGIAVVANAAIDKRESGIGGEVVVSVPVDLAPIKARIAPQTGSATLALGTASVPLVASSKQPGTDLVLPIDVKTLEPGTLSLHAVLEAIPRPADPRKRQIKIARAACLGLAAGMVLVFVASLFRRS
jgi:hypothetical protein